MEISQIIVPILQEISAMYKHRITTKWYEYQCHYKGVKIKMGTTVFMMAVQRISQIF